MSAARGLAAALLVVVAVVVQVSWLVPLPLPGAVPDLVLVVVVGLALAAGPGPGAVAGFAAGLCLDLAPPSVAALGSTSLVLTVVGYAAGSRTRGADESRLVGLLVVAGSAVAAGLLSWLVGLALGPGGRSFTTALGLVPTAVLYDVVLALAVLPLTRRLSRRPRPRSLAL